MCFKITFEYSYRGGVFSNIRLSMVMQLICLIFRTFDRSNEGSQHAVSEETKPTHCTLSFLETTKDIGTDWQFKLTKHASKAWRKPFETLLLRWKTLDCWVPLNLPSNKNLCPKAKWLRQTHTWNFFCLTQLRNSFRVLILSILSPVGYWSGGKENFLLKAEVDKVLKLLFLNTIIDMQKKKTCQTF